MKVDRGRASNVINDGKRRSLSPVLYSPIVIFNMKPQNTYYKLVYQNKEDPSKYGYVIVRRLKLYKNYKIPRYRAQFIYGSSRKFESSGKYYTFAKPYDMIMLDPKYVFKKYFIGLL